MHHPPLPHLRTATHQRAVEGVPFGPLDPATFRTMLEGYLDLHAMLAGLNQPLLKTLVEMYREAA